MYQPTNMKLWKRPECYAGESWPEYYVVIGQHRDSALLDSHNFSEIETQLDVLINKLGVTHLPADPEEYTDGEAPVLVHPREGHWAVGWVEWLGLHKDSPAEVLQLADELLGKLQDYPILNEDAFSDAEWNATQELWMQLPIRERVELCQKNRINIFAARHDWIPQDDNGGIYEYCRPE
jgi:hypothetical protein